jgi:large subunit ribosomal protein L6
LVKRPSDEERHKALHGLTRTLVANMVEGVTKGFQKTLEITGVGYKAEIKPYGALLSLGFSHQIEYKSPEGVKISAPNPTTVIIDGASKETGRPGCGRDSQLPQARALQGQGRQVSRRSYPA